MSCCCCCGYLIYLFSNKACREVNFCYPGGYVQGRQGLCLCVWVIESRALHTFLRFCKDLGEHKWFCTCCHLVYDLVNFGLDQPYCAAYRQYLCSIGVENNHFSRVEEFPFCPDQRVNRKDHITKACLLQLFPVLFLCGAVGYHYCWCILPDISYAVFCLKKKIGADHDNKIRPPILEGCRFCRFLLPHLCACSKYTDCYSLSRCDLIK